MIDNHPRPASPLSGGGAFLNLAFPLSGKKVAALKAYACNKDLMQPLVPAIDEIEE